MTDITELLEKIETKKVEYQEFIKQQQVEMLAAAEGLFTAVFDNFDFVEAIVWTQYTPGFNDGDPCEFGVHDFYVMGKGYLESDEVGEYAEENEHRIEIEEPNYALKRKANGESLDEWDVARLAAWDELLETYGEDTIKSLNKALAALQGLPDEIYESFGEGLVVASREGIDLYEYDCGY